MLSTDKEFSSESLENLPHKTPFFLFSENKIKGNIKKFKHLFPGASINYAMKANAEPELLSIVADVGSEFEVASVYELNMLKDLKVSPDKIIYGTSVKPTAHIKEFFDYGVDRFAFDSLPELEKIAAVAPGSRVYVRVIVNDSGSVFKFSEKFGTDMGNAIPMLKRARDLGLKPYGISFHVGSQASNPLAWAKGLEDLREIVDNLKKGGIEIEILNLGGGFPCQYASNDNIPSLEDIAYSTLKQFNTYTHKPKLILEPGRGIVADTGVMVVSVIARVERKGGTWLFLDAGVYSGLFETMAYQGSTRYPITSLRPAMDSGEMLFSLAGPTGDSPDIITKEVLLPQDIGEGDKLVIHNVGAYSLVATCKFNGFPKPDVYFV